MKIVLEWLQEYIDHPLSAQVVADALLNAGLPVESIAQVAGQTVLDVEVTSNRTDCLSHVGVAREVAALLGYQFMELKNVPSASMAEVGSSVTVAIENANDCPFYSARVIQNVKVAPSPEWLRIRLEALGLRSVNNVVDVTNYVLMELGQPLHAFDAGCVKNHAIHVRRARAGETMVMINGASMRLDPAMLVIADSEQPLALAGVMGGKASEVTDQTHTILLESARFESLIIRHAARNLALMSDSSYRFERGIDPTLAVLASQRATQMICELAGGTVAGPIIEQGLAGAPELSVKLRLSRITEILGYEIPADTALSILDRLGFQPKLAGAVCTCQVTSHRLDVSREIDLIEEIARVYGYQHIPLESAIHFEIRGEADERKARKIVNQVLLAAGCDEVMTVSFVDERLAKKFVPANNQVLKVRDSVRKASNAIRSSLLPSLLSVARTNQNAGQTIHGLYEIAPVFHQAAVSPAGVPTEIPVVGILGVDLSAVKGIVELLVARINPQAALIVQPESLPGTKAGTAASLKMVNAGQTHTLGWIGVVDPRLSAEYDLRQEPAYAELRLTPLLTQYQAQRLAVVLPRYPGVTRDLSIVVAEAVRWLDIENALRGVNIAQLESIAFVGTFRGKQIPAGQKSVTLSLTFRSNDTTLRADEVDTQMTLALQTLQAAFGAILRA
jgi:phenylalanyl-tRNA synthetase beta chain